MDKRGNFGVILSPQFYWVKKVKLPVTSVRAAKKLARSVYEESLPESDFTYHVEKVDDEFIIIAYDKEDINKSFQSAFADDRDIKAVYFAQNELQDIKSCKNIDAFSALTNIDGLLVQVPRSCTNSTSSVDGHLKNISLSNKKISFALNDQVALSDKTLYAIVSFFAIFFISYMIEYVSYKVEMSNLSEQRAQIIDKYDLPATSMQLKSIKSSLLNSYMGQKKIRDVIYKLSKIKLQEGEHIQSIQAGKANVRVDIQIPITENEASLKSRVSKELNIKNWTIQGDIITIEIKV